MCCPFRAQAEKTVTVQNEPDTVWVRQFHEDMVTDVIFSPDGSLLITVGHDQKINIISTATAEIVRTIETPSRQFHLIFGVHGEGLYSCGVGSEVYLWDITTGEQKRMYTIGHKAESAAIGIKDMTLSQDGRYLATSAFYDAIVTDVQTGEEVLKFTMDEQYLRTNSVSFTPDGKLIVVGCDTGRLYVVDVESGSIVHSSRPADVLKGGVRYSPDGTLIAVGVISKETGNHLLIFKADSVVQKYQLEVQGAVEDMAFSPGGKHLVSTSNDGYIYIWDVERGELVRSYSYADPFGGLFGQRSIAISPDSTYIASVLAYYQVGLWNAHWTTSTGVAELASPLQAPTITTDAAGHTLQLHFTLATPAVVTVEIVDIQGRVSLVQSNTYNAGVQEQTIAMPALARGAYYCRFQTGDHTFVRPFTITR